MKKDVLKDFNKREEEVNEQGQNFLDLFIENKADFLTKYPEFAIPFETDMQDQIDLCRSIDTDQVCVSKQHLATVEVKDTVDHGGVIFQDFLPYVTHGFPNNPAILQLFGKPFYEKARNSSTKMQKLLMQAYEMASDTDYKAKLIAKGATEPIILEFKTTSDLIETKLKKQRKLKGARGMSTQNRILEYNILWAMMVRLSEVAKVIYKDNPVMWNNFLLYPEAPEGGIPPTPPPPTV